MPQIDSQLQTALSDLGFSDKETRVYLALLSLGRGTVSAIARAAGINRTTGYNILDVLVSKGLARISGKEPKEEYVAESPSVIPALLKQKIANYKTQLEKAMTLVPRLKTIHNLADRPKVKFYEGQEGYLTVYENILKNAPKELLVISSYDDFYKHIDEKYETDWTQRRIDKKIYLRWLDFKTDWSWIY